MIVAVAELQSRWQHEGSSPPAAWQSQKMAKSRNLVKCKLMFPPNEVILINLIRLSWDVGTEMLVCCLVVKM
jgi:hypothetical protein